MRILFVCTGNICRSPTAEAVMRRMAADAGVGDAVKLDSAGLGDWHLDHPPDRRAVAAAERRGYDLSDMRARLVRPADFEAFELIVPMTRDHERELNAMSSGRGAGVRRMLTYAPSADRHDVPDPFYGDARGFETMLDLIEDASRGLLAEVRDAWGR